MNNFWDKNDTISEYDLLQDSIDMDEIDTSSNEIVEYDDIDDESIEEIQSNSSYELDEEETTIIYNARLKLEQARLYEMLIDHNLFEGVEADEQAIYNVQNEIKQYIVYRLEVLLGIRQPKQTTNNININQFNEIEVDFLKQLAYKGTKGASAQVEVSENTEQVQPQPMKNTTKPKVNKINALKSKPKTIKKVEQPKTKQKNKKTTTSEKKVVKDKVPKKTTKKTKSNKKESIRDKVKSGNLGKRILTRKEAEAIAKEELQQQKNKKPWHKMTAKEKTQEVLRVNNKHNKRKAKSKLSIPSPEQQEMMYMQQQLKNNNSQDQNTRINSMVANMLSMQKKQQSEE